LVKCIGINDQAKSELLVSYAIIIISTFSTLITGFLFDASGYGHNFMKLIFFIIFLIIASVSTAIQFVLEEKE